MATTEMLLQSVWSDDATIRTTYNPNSSYSLSSRVSMPSSQDAEYLASGPELVTTF